MRVSQSVRMGVLKVAGAGVASGGMGGRNDAEDGQGE